MKLKIITNILLIAAAHLQIVHAQTVYEFKDQGKIKQYQIDRQDEYGFDVGGRFKTSSLVNFLTSDEQYLDSLEIRKAISGKSTDISLYPVGKQGLKQHLRIVRKKMLLAVKDGTDADALQQRLGAINHEVVKAEPSTLVILEFGDSVDVLEGVDKCQNDAAVISAEPLFTKWWFKMAIPNDPRFLYGKDINEKYQWHLYNTGENNGIAGIDANVINVWDNYTGAGVTVAIADDGLQITHPDLAPNSNNNYHHNWNTGNSGDPSPIDPADNHGTAVGGVTAAKGNNNIGGSGAAPDAELVGLRWLAEGVNDAELGQVMGWRTDVIDVHNNSWGIPGSWLYPMSSLINAGIMNGINTGRGGLGTIYVFAAGNSAEDNGNANYQGEQNSIHTIAVGAINDIGQKSYYSNPGCALVISAPSNGMSQRQGITTTTTTANGDGYTDSFGGTSSACPLTAGVVALILEANPNLGWRDVQEILIASARRNDYYDGDWIVNGTGYHFNHKYGAGMVDAEAAVALAQGWTNLGTQTVEIAAKTVATTIKDMGKSVRTLFDLSQTVNKRVEHVEVYLDISHLKRADLECVLVSPSGTRSRLTDAYRDLSGESDIDYTFMSTFNWGEYSAGTWRVEVRDKRAGTSGTFRSATIKVYGVEDPDGVPPTVTSAERIGTIVNTPLPMYTLTTSQDAIVTMMTALPAGLSYNSVTQQITGTPTAIGIYQVLFEIENLAQTYTVRFILTIAVGEIPANDLAGAIEQDGANVYTDSWNGWLLELDDTWDGSDAIASPNYLGNSQSSSVALDHYGGGIVLFDWKVSSEESYDRFWFYPNGDRNSLQTWAAFMSGEMPWGTYAVQLNSNESHLKWVYEKDRSVARGEDRAFLDNVRVETKENYLSMLTAASSSNLTFETNSRALWVPVPMIDAGSDDFAIRSSSVGNGQYSDLTAMVPGPGMITFKWMVSSEITDMMQFYNSGSMVASISGEEYWQSMTFNVGDGERQLLWRYVKDIEASGGYYDAGFLDDIVFTQFTTFSSWITQMNQQHQNARQAMSNADQSIEDLASLDPDADPNANGVSNYLEFAFGGDPFSADSSLVLPQVVSDKNGLGYTYMEYGLRDVAYHIEKSTDLTSWDKVDPSELVRGMTVDDITPIRYNLTQDDIDSGTYFRVVTEKRTEPAEE